MPIRKKRSSLFHAECQRRVKKFLKRWRQIAGTYTFESQENFEGYLEAAGNSQNNLSPTQYAAIIIKVAYLGPFQRRFK